MKNICLLISFLLILISGCGANKETTNLENYLKSFNLNINDYKVICIVPVDGCGSCIDPSLKYAKDTRKDYLLIMSSMFKKSIEYTIERLQINSKNYISDNNNLAQEAGLVTAFAPCYYFLRYGEVVKKFDLSKTNNKTGILDEVEQFFIAEDTNINEMQKLEKQQKP
jgi:hypothetical protein